MERDVPVKEEERLVVLGNDQAFTPRLTEQAVKAKTTTTREEEAGIERTMVTRWKMENNKKEKNFE